MGVGVSIFSVMAKFCGRRKTPMKRVYGTTYLMLSLTCYRNEEKRKEQNRPEPTLRGQKIVSILQIGRANQIRWPLPKVP